MDYRTREAWIAGREGSPYAATPRKTPPPDPGAKGLSPDQAETRREWIEGWLNG